MSQWKWWKPFCLRKLRQDKIIGCCLSRTPPSSSPVSLDNFLKAQLWWLAVTLLGPDSYTLDLISKELKKPIAAAGISGAVSHLWGWYKFQGMLKSPGCFTGGDTELMLSSLNLRVPEAGTAKEGAVGHC